MTVPFGSNYNLNGSITYNGWTFTGPRVMWKIHGVPEKSGDGRTTLCNRYILTLRAIVTDDPNGLAAHVGVSSSQDSSTYSTNLQTATFKARGNLQKIRALLSKNGGALDINGMGWDIHLNKGTTDSMFDVRWGPTTKSLSIEPIGNGVVFQVDWVLEFSIPECYNNRSGDSGHTQGTGNSEDVSYLGFPYKVSGLARMGIIESLVFEVHYDIDSAGLTERHVSGYITVAFNRSITIGGSIDPSDVNATCDAVREAISPAIPDKFKRMGSHWRLSSDRTRLTFMIVDKELPGRNAYPPGVLDMYMTHRVISASTNLATNAPPTISNRFTGYFEVEKTAPIGLAFDKIVLIIQQRINAQTTDAQKQLVVVNVIDLEETIYGPRRLQFMISYEIIGLSQAALLSDLIARTALFTDVNVDGLTFEAWRDSMIDSKGTTTLHDGTVVPIGPWSQRGIAGLSFSPQEDTIVGPCDGPFGSLTMDYQPGYYIQNYGGSIRARCPVDPYNYEVYDSEIWIENEAGGVTHYPMTSSDIGEADFEDVETNDGESATLIGDYRKPPSEDVSSRTQYLTAGSIVTLHFKGAGIRLNNHVEIPKIITEKFTTKLKGKRISLKKNLIKRKQAGSLGPCARLAAMWDIEYDISGISDPSDIADLIGALRVSLVSTVADPGDGTSDPVKGGGSPGDEDGPSDA